MRAPADLEEQFISERIRPAPEAIETFRMARGEPGLPRRFTWRNREYVVAKVIESWKELGPCSSGADEQYVRKHWLRIETACGEEMRIYCDRQAKPGSDPKARWWLYAIRRRPAEGPA
jgi:hypothetical protein